MNRDDLIARAKAIIAEAYEEATELVVEYLDRHPGEQLAPLCREIDPDNWNALRNRVQKAAAAREASGEAKSAARARETERKQRAHAKSALSDPEQRQQVIRDLPADVREKIVRETTESVVADARAARAEHDVKPEPTARDLMGPGEKFNPAEYWADTLVIRVNRNARELSKLVDRAGGLLFGTMPPEEAFDYLHEAERLIAEVRAAAQEQVRDRTEI